jgi:hypothetical protein
MFSRAHSALVEALHLSEAPLRLVTQAGDCPMFGRELCATCRSSTGSFEPSWRLHNVWQSTFSFGRSSVHLAEAPPRFLSHAGDSTIFGGAHSALVEALCFSSRLHHLRRRCLAQGPELYPLQHLWLDFLVKLEASQCSVDHIQPWSKFSATCQTSAESFEPSWRLDDVWRSTFSFGVSSVHLAEALP